MSRRSKIQAISVAFLAMTAGLFAETLSPGEIDAEILPPPPPQKSGVDDVRVTDLSPVEVSRRGAVSRRIVASEYSKCI